MFFGDPSSSCFSYPKFSICSSLQFGYRRWRGWKSRVGPWLPQLPTKRSQVALLLWLQARVAPCTVTLQGIKTGVTGSMVSHARDEQICGPAMIEHF